jgi:hypothetical protein
MELATPGSGDKTIQALDAHWEVGCPQHRGRVTVEERELDNPDTGEKVINPVWSEDIGHQTDCDDCAGTLHAVHRHIRAVNESRERISS